MMDREENGEDDDEENWWELWDQRRRMAVVQVICHLVCDSRQCNERIKKGGKRKACTWGRELESIREAIGNVADAIIEGNAIHKRAREHVYSKEQELVKIGVEKHLSYTAYASWLKIMQGSGLFLVTQPMNVKTLCYK